MNKLLRCGLGGLMLVMILSCPTFGQNSLTDDINDLNDLEVASIINELLDYLKYEQPPQPVIKSKVRKNKYNQHSSKK